MGCCCAGLPIVPDKAPVPPPVCTVRRFANVVSRTGKSESTGVSTNAQLLIDEAAAWSAFGVAAFTEVDHTGLLPEKVIGSYEAAFRLHFFSPSNRGSLAIYKEARAYLMLPLVHEIGGTQYSLEQLYGVSQLTLAVSLPLYGAGVFTSANTYTQAWSTWDVHWGMLDVNDVYSTANTPATSLGGFGAPYRIAPAVSASGLLDVCTNSLASGLTVSGAGVAANTAGSGSVSVVLDSIVSQTGGDFLILLCKVPDATVSRKTPAIDDPPLFSALLEGHGPTPRTNLSVSPAATGYLAEEIWGCIKSMTVRVQIEQATSSIVEEDRTGTLTYSSGQNLTKKFSRNDNSTGVGMASTSEDIDPNSNVNTLWNTYDHAGLDKTSRFPATPNASTAVDYDASDDNEAQTWGLESLVNTYTNNTIDVTVYAYNSAADKDAETVKASIKLGGSFVTDQDLYWENAEDGWKSAVLATSKSNSDFSGAEVRLTSPTVGLSGGKTFEAIYCHVEGDNASSSIVIERTIEVYLTESGGSYYLTFGFYRDADPTDSTYYVGRITTPFTDVTALGAVGRETLGDIIGTDFVFSHDGADNDDTGLGTEDATITFTIQSIAV